MLDMSQKKWIDIRITTADDAVVSLCEDTRQFF